MSRQDSSPGRVLLSNNGHIYLANYDGSSFDITLTGDDSGHSPSWLAFTEPNLLYAVDEWSNTTRLFELDVAGDKLEKKTEALGSSGVVHLEFSKDRTRMVGAAYGQGTIDIWDISSGGLTLLKTLESDGELGPNKERQTAPHPHQSLLDPSGRFFAVNDLGTDEILLIDSADDAFTVAGRAATPPGSGPRHGAFYPSDAEKATHYFVLCEITNIIVVYSLSYTDSSIEFTKIQEISSFGPDATPSGDAAAGELALVGDHVYISNRLTGGETDDISHFSITSCSSDKKELKFVDSVSTGGKLPRMFSVSSSGKELLVGNQGGALGLVSIGLNEDGSMKKDFAAKVEASVFGEDGFGPQFVQQIA
ncbi:lactonase, 7-bladed beta-propeller domain-containing protein [Sarocladium implicatum]|nr:lactonase, 7-bladed beta-propeller domain-containing protein [Sarocladium implicatum]